MKRILVLLVAAGLCQEVSAFPLEAIGAFFAKLFKPGAIVKEAAVVGSATEGATTKGVARLPAVESASRTASSLPVAVEPHPNAALQPIAQNPKDAETYKALRRNAEKGDSQAMLKMSSLTISGKVSDPGEPYHAYWLIQAIRVGSQQGPRQLRKECEQQKEMRKTDEWFDSACKSLDGQTLYAAAWGPRDDDLNRRILRILQQ